MEPVYGLARATDVGPADPEQPLSLCVRCPSLDRKRCSSSSTRSATDSPIYCNFITPEEVGERFGLLMEK
jgi:hypothetical protein